MGFNAQPGRHGRSPETENPAQWAASLAKKKKEQKSINEVGSMPQIVLSSPPTLTEFIKLRKALPPIDPNTPRSSLSDRFLIPPFSVLDARQGYWQKRKKMWLELGIQSELGRGEGANNQSEMSLRLAGGFENHPAHKAKLANATPGGSPLPAATLKDGKTQRGDGRGRPLGAHPIPGGGTGKDLGDRRLAKAYNIGMQANKDNNWSTEDNQGSGTSIFDPVLCEIAYRWFCPQDGRVLDPFAGGSVRGIVAARLGRAYAGVDLRQEQADANYAQMETLCSDADITWAVGDSVGISNLLPGEYDLVFSCPPYADLERYSDDPRDLSTMEYSKFLEVYRSIISASCAMLKDNRFACFVVGDVRDRVTGNYRGFVNDTIDAFRLAGLELYNEAVLVTAVGSLPIRVGRQFAGCRKLGKTHQNVLVFVKGDPVLATEACGEVDIDDLSMPDCVDGSIALCKQDVAGSIAERYLVGEEECDVGHVYLPPTESYLLVDIVRAQLRSEGKPTPRAWLGTKEGWTRIDEGSELTYMIGDTPYLSRTLFPDAKGPTCTVPVPKRLRS